MMKPAEKIDSIRIHQVTGFGGSRRGNGGGSGGDGDAAQPPVTQVMDSILGMALQLPALKSIGESIGVDLSAAVGAPKRATARRRRAPDPQATGRGQGLTPRSQRLAAIRRSQRRR